MRVGIVRDQNGVSLVELMVALVVGALIIYAVTQFTVLQQRTYSREGKIQNAQQSVRAAMLFMSNEIRMAGYDTDADCLPDTNADSTPDGVSAPSTSTTLTINTCTTTSPAWNTVTYTRDATDNTITREETSCTLIPCDGSPGEAQPIADDITSLSFTYYNAADTAFTPADQDERDTIRRIAISMTATTDNGQTRPLTSNVGLRNMDMED